MLYGITKRKMSHEESLSNGYKGCPDVKILNLRPKNVTGLQL